MKRGFRLLVTALLVTFFWAADSFAISRVTRQLNVFEMGIGYSDPIGSYDRIHNINFVDQNSVPVAADASLLYDGTYHLGAGFGQVWGEHFLGTLRFNYTKVAITNFTKSTFYDSDGIIPSFNQYDFKFDFDFQFNDIARTSWTPYVGLGFAAGFTRLSAPGFSSSSEANVGLAANFGAEVKVWAGREGRNFMTIGSINSVDFASSGYRPRYLNIGVGLRYYMRP
jgi:hypothetical protein